MDNLPLLIECPYFGNIAFFARCWYHKNVILEAKEHYQKATYRNRCEIATPNGMLTLSVPVKGGKDVRLFAEEVQIANDEDWSRLHWRSLADAYRRSPYFEFYEDSLQTVFDKVETHLLSLSLSSLEWVNSELELGIRFSKTFNFQKKPKSVVDFRSNQLPKHRSNESFWSKDLSYHQVFEDRHGFIPNLSILDLMFNEGPKAKEVLSRFMEQQL